MSLEVYNQIMSDMLNQRHALTKLRAKLEGREGRICKRCGRFGHLAWKYRGREEEKKVVRGNRFKVLKSRVMQCGMREVRRQKVVREAVKCFGYRQEGHKKRECLQKKERRGQEVAPL